MDYDSIAFLAIAYDICNDTEAAVRLDQHRAPHLDEYDEDKDASMRDWLWE